MATNHVYQTATIWATVPAGMNQGDELKLQHNGEQYTITVPPNLGPDRKVSVKVPTTVRKGAGPWWNPVKDDRPPSQAHGLIPQGMNTPNFNTASAALIGELTGLSEEMSRTLRKMTAKGAISDWSELMKKGRRRVFGLGAAKMPKLREKFHLGAGAIYRQPRRDGQRPYGKSQANSKCPHGKGNNGYTCKDCNGEGLCIHRRVKSRCKECQKILCPHGKPKGECPICCPKKLDSKKCPHGKCSNGRFCIQCNGKGLCVHKKNKYYCKECNTEAAGGKRGGLGGRATKVTPLRPRTAAVVKYKRGSTAAHTVRVGHSKNSNAARGRAPAPKRTVKLCPHGRGQNGYFCIQCQGGGVCAHGTNKFTCRKCNGKGGGIDPVLTAADWAAIGAKKRPAGQISTFGQRPVVRAAGVGMPVAANKRARVGVPVARPL